jgi:ribose transport system substrate-binding protein
MNNSEKLNRREFLKKSAGIAGTASLLSMGSLGLSSAFAAGKKAEGELPEGAKLREVGVKEDERYVMCTFLSGIEFWIPCYNGMKAAAAMLGVEAVYQGIEAYDAIVQATVLDQIIASNPAGIVTTAQNPEALKPTINKAVSMGVPLVMFDSDSPEAKRPVFLAGDNYQFGVKAAHMMADFTNQRGKILITTTIGQHNMMQRANGFKDTIEQSYPNMKVVGMTEEGSDYAYQAARVSEVLQAHPDLAGVWSTGSHGPGAVQAAKEAGKGAQVHIITMDIDDRLMEMIEAGDVAATFVQGGWNMGFWSMSMVFTLAHNLVQPIPSWKEAGISPLPSYVDTGGYLVTKENVQYFKKINVPVKYS